MTDWIVNNSWVDQNQDFTEMKVALRRGDYKTLNLYIVNLTNPSIGGECSHPVLEKKKTPDKARRLAEDGCVVSTATLDGSLVPTLNMGVTAVHEVGHWFGLWHTFESGLGSDGDSCSPANPDDEVSDTPKMILFEPWQCIEDDTCPDDKGADPIHNYMAYTSDACRYEFTKGQAQVFSVPRHQSGANFCPTETACMLSMTNSGRLGPRLRTLLWFF